MLLEDGDCPVKPSTLVIRTSRLHDRITYTCSFLSVMLSILTTLSRGIFLDLPRFARFPCSGVLHGKATFHTPSHSISTTASRRYALLWGGGEVFRGLPPLSEKKHIRTAHSFPDYRCFFCSHVSNIFYILPTFPFYQYNNIRFNDLRLWGGSWEGSFCLSDPSHLPTPTVSDPTLRKSFRRILARTGSNSGDRWAYRRGASSDCQIVVQSAG